MKCEVSILACSMMHMHVLCKLTESDAIKQLGKAKQFASLRLKNHSGQLWGERSKIVVIRDESHLQNTLQYIQDHAIKENAWVWLPRCISPTNAEPEAEPTHAGPEVL